MSTEYTSLIFTEFTFKAESFVFCRPELRCSQMAECPRPRPGLPTSGDLVRAWLWRPSPARMVLTALSMTPLWPMWVLHINEGKTFPWSTSVCKAFTHLNHISQTSKTPRPTTWCCVALAKENELALFPLKHQQCHNTTVTLFLSLLCWAIIWFRIEFCCLLFEPTATQKSLAFDNAMKQQLRWNISTEQVFKYPEAISSIVWLSVPSSSEFFVLTLHLCEWLWGFQLL